MEKAKLAANLIVLTLLLTLVVNVSKSLAFAQTPVPVEGASVTAFGGNGYGYTSTDTQGFYNITTTLDTGNYTVEAQAVGFVDTSIENVHVNAGSETPNINVIMPVSGGISGRITDAVSGVPLQFVLVDAINITNSFEYGSSDFTDSNGNYQIVTNLASGIYNVTVTFATGYVTKTITGVSVTTGAMTNNINLALDRSAVVSGTVRDSVTSVVLEGVTVYATTPSGSFITAATTNSSGMYTLDTNLGTGTYNITAPFPSNHIAKTMGGIAVVAGNQYTANLALDPSGIISGQVTSATSGLPLVGAFVTASSTAGSGFATTDATGHYRITDGLGTGTYIVFASYGGGFNSVLGVSVTQGVETSNVNVLVILAPSGTITGRVVNATGTPMPDVDVSAEGLAGSGSATTNSTGYYVIDTGLPTGTYNVTASAFGFATQTATGVSVTVGQVTSNVNFQLQALVSGRISGFVRTIGTPIPEFNAGLIIAVIFVAASLVITIEKLKNPKFKPFNPR